MKQIGDNVTKYIYSLYSFLSIYSYFKYFKIFKDVFSTLVFISLRFIFNEKYEKSDQFVIRQRIHCLKYFLKWRQQKSND